MSRLLRAGYPVHTSDQGSSPGANDIFVLHDVRLGNHLLDTGSIDLSFLVCWRRLVL